MLDDLRRVEEDLSAFGLSAEDDEILKLFSGLSNKHGISPSTLVEKYVAFKHNRGLSDCLSANDIALFEKENLISSINIKASRVPEGDLIDSSNLLPHEMRKEIMFNKNFDEQADIVSSYLGKPAAYSPLRPSNLNAVAAVYLRNVPVAASDILCSFSNRPGDQQVHVPASSPPFNWQIQSVEAGSTTFRFMYQRPLVKSEILDSWTWEQVRLLVDSLPSSSLDSNTEAPASQKLRFSLSTVLEGSQNQEDPNRPRKTATSVLRPIHSRLQIPSLVAGRVAVCPEAVSAGVVRHQRLDTTNACIIGTRRAGGGDLGKVMLDVSTNAATLEYSLYTGQPVVFKASNVSGRSLTAFEFIQPKVLPVFDVRNVHMFSDEPDLHVAIACGPFTTNTSHDIAPLLSLLKSVKEFRPHALILLGPLVDASHPLIGEYCDSTFDELYQTRLNAVAEWCYLLKIKLIVVSSWREVCGNPVYPTPPQFLSKPNWALKYPHMTAWYEDVTFVWDPSTIRIGPYYIGVTSPDVLFQMSSQEISANCTGDRLSRLCRHVLTSGTYYPVHPAAEELPLDYPLWWEHARLPSECSPHCIVLPSRLRYFIKDVDGVVCVNPGLTARSSSTSGGSYARLVFSSKSSASDKVSEGHSNRGPVTVHGVVFQL